MCVCVCVRARVCLGTGSLREMTIMHHIVVWVLAYCVGSLFVLSDHRQTRTHRSGRQKNAHQNKSKKNQKKWEKNQRKFLIQEIWKNKIQKNLRSLRTLRSLRSLRIMVSRLEVGKFANFADFANFYEVLKIRKIRKVRSFWNSSRGITRGCQSL